jgi:hypothetical protein
VGKVNSTQASKPGTRNADPHPSASGGWFSASSARFLPTSISGILVILGQTVVGFLLAWSDPPSRPVIGFPPLAVFASSPALRLGIACLAGLLAHALGLFLQSEEYLRARTTSRDEGAASSVPAYPAYVLALVTLVISSCLGLWPALAAGALLLATIAYYRTFWRRGRLGAASVAVSCVLSILLGAVATCGPWQAVFGWKVWLAAAVLAAYAGSTEFLVSRAWAFRPLGVWPWVPMTLAGLGAGAFLVTAFCRLGVAAACPWLSIFLLLWLLVRTAHLGRILKARPGLATLQDTEFQLDSGMILLEASSLVGLLKDWEGVIAFSTGYGVLFASLLLRPRPSAKA